MVNKRSIKSVCMAVLALCLFVTGLLGGRQMLSAFAEEAAEERVYTNVLADLQKDESFNVINYPEQDEDFLRDSEKAHLQVIQIAESTSGELYLYTYQPCQKIMPISATEINMALSESVNGTSLFPLTLLNTNGVFCKYLVGGVVVSSDTTRYYNITSIYRDYIKGLDKEMSGGGTKNAVAYEVGKVFEVETVDGVVSYKENKIDTIRILNPFAGSLRYYDSWSWGFIGSDYSYTDAHYIAFDTDLPIDTLKEADVSYYTQTYTAKLQSASQGGGYKYTYGDEVKQPDKTITRKDDGCNVGDGFLAVRYTWKRIQRSADFKNTVSLDESARTEIDKTKWVLIFLETEAKRDYFGTANPTIFDKDDWSGMRVSKVTILRLQFVTAGKPYNLGAVSDKVTESENPSGGAKALGWLDLLCKWLEQLTGLPAWVWKIIICALPFIILLPVLSFIFPVVGRFFIAVFKGLWWFICLPFKGIAALVQRAKE